MTLNFDTVTLTFDLWPWTFVMCRLFRSETLYEIWAQSGNTRRSYCSLNFDLMTLNMYHVLRYALRYFAQSLNSVKLPVREIWRFFHANKLCHAVTLTYDPLTLNFCGRSGIMGTIYVPNLSEIDHSAAELLTINDSFRPFLGGAPILRELFFENAWTDLHQTWWEYCQIIATDRV